MNYELLIDRLQSAATAVADLDADNGFRERATQLLARLHPVTVRELSLALALMDHPLTGLVWGLHPGRMRHLPRTARANRIRSMASSRIPRVRSIAAAVRSAGAALLWSDPVRCEALAPREAAP